MNSRRLLPLAILFLFLASCGGILLPLSPATDTPPVLTTTPMPALLPTPTSGPHTLTVCTGSEPADLFRYNELTSVKKIILSALFEGPIDVGEYNYQPVILLKLPSLEDGDAVIQPVAVVENGLVMDAAGVLTALSPGVLVRPAGCSSSACALVYESGMALEMDQMRVTFQIRPGVQWTDGAPVTAQDSVYGYRLAVSPEILYGNNALVSGSAQSVTFTDSYIAQDELSTLWVGRPGFLDTNYQTNFFHPFPEHQLSSYTVAQVLEANEVLYSPLGWGAYRVTSWVPGGEMILGPNPNYYRRLDGLPTFEKLVFRYTSPDPIANLASLERNLCDIALPDVLGDVPTETTLQMVVNGTVRVYPDLETVPGAGSRVMFEHLLFNVSPLDASTPSPFSSLNVRQAVDLCLDRVSLTQAIYAGLVAPLDFALPQDHPLLEGSSLQMPQFNLQLAGSQLDATGWRDEDGDGIRESHAVTGFPDGQPMNVQLVAPDDPFRVVLSELVASQLRTCGMNVTSHLAPARDLLAQNAEALLSGRHFDLALLSSPMGVESMCNLAGSTQISGAANGWSGSNLSGSSNVLFDAACEQVNSSLPGTPGYMTSRQTALLLFTQAELVVPLFQHTRFTMADPTLIGLEGGWQAIESFRIGP